MTIRPTLAALALLLAFSVSADPVAARADVATGARTPADDSGHARQADAATRAFVAQHDVPAAHVTILHGDRVVLQRGYGAADARGRTPDATSVFPIGSISKQFTAAAILALVDAGKLRLDAPVGEYLPEWFADEPGLRVAHLLAQTSGLADFLWLEGYRALADDPATPIAAYVALGAAEPRRFAPGTRWAYSNTNYKALALIAERVDERPFAAVLAERVLRPAGIEGVAACHDLPDGTIVPGVALDGAPRPLDASPAAYVGDGGLCASAAALVQWLHRVLASDDPGYARLRQPTRLADGSRVPYGFGVSVREFLDQPTAWHGGNVDSHSTLLAYLPQRDVGVVILTAKGFLWPTELLPALIGLAAPTPTGAATRARTPGSGPVSVPLPTGHFDDGLFRYEIGAAATAAVERRGAAARRDTGATTRVVVGPIGPLEFVPAGDREWIARDLPATFRIRLPADGSRDRFEVDWGELRSYAQRVAE